LLGYEFQLDTVWRDEKLELPDKCEIGIASGFEAY